MQIARHVCELIVMYKWFRIRRHIRKRAKSNSKMAYHLLAEFMATKFKIHFLVSKMQAIPLKRLFFFSKNYFSQALATVKEFRR